MTKVIVTGTTGGLGSILVERLLKAGYEVYEFSRKRYHQNTQWTFFDLRHPTDTAMPYDVSVIIHCAHDFTVKNWQEMCDVNVEGTLKFFQRANQHSSPLFIFVSSMAAFDGAKSNYGRGKREIEKKLLDQGAICVRPGLIYGVKHGLVERIRSISDRGGIIPLIGGGKLTTYPISVREVCDGLISILTAPQKYQGNCVVLASSEPKSFRSLLDLISQANSKWRIYMPVPWWLVWFSIRVIEFLGINVSFKSDSVLGLRFQNLSPFKNVLSLDTTNVQKNGSIL